MENKMWIEASVYIESEANIEPMFGLLLSLGINGAEIVDQSDFNSFLENYTDYWDYVDEQLVEDKKCPTHLKVYFRDSAEGREQLAMLRQALANAPETGFVKMELDNIDEDAWFENWKKYFAPLPVGEKILVIPEWDNETTDDNRLCLRINPGMLFGTGGHHTTSLCMQMLEKLVTSETKVLDIGCGSGILSILSLLLGAKEAYAVDIDPAAPKIAYQNAALNGFYDDKYFVKAGNILSDEALQKEYAENKCEIVVANIVADVIIPLSAITADFMTDDGTFICSGIINDRLGDVTEALLKNGFEICEKQSGGEWWAIRCKRRK